VPDPLRIHFRQWLPSFNAKVDFGNGMLVRAAISKGMFRPDLSSFASGGGISDNTANLKAGGTLATGPLFQIGTGNRFLRPTQSWNYDLSFEWYFNRVGSLAISAFMKDIKAIVNSGAILSGLGSQLTYTYVDAKDFNNSSLGAAQSPLSGGLPLAGVSKHTINAVAFYEKGPLSARVAYNWRSDFLQTPRDVIFPFSPIYGEATGQLDASVFFAATKQIKFGVQGVNLLDEVTRTSQVIDFKGTRATRSAFRNDRRYTLLARFDF